MLSIRQETKKQFYTRLVKTIYEKHGDLQIAMIKEFAKNVRKCDAEMLIKYHAFFVPDNMYLFNLLGGDATAPQFGMYFNEYCYFVKRLVIPIYGFDGMVHGFVGYDNGDELKTEEERCNHVYYLYQSKRYFDKDKYMLITPEEYKDAWDKQFICLVDGIFDKMTVNGLGFPASSLLSSRLTKYHLKYLRYIKNWIIIADNDDAGTMLEEYAKYCHCNTIRLKFDGAKDIDEYVHQNESNKNKFLCTMKLLGQMGFTIDWMIA